jgi:phosphohistidine swiveling domain-containing protein
MLKKWVYLFSEGDAQMRNLLGGKGANLAEMVKLGLPVPPGFTITTEACNEYYRLGRQFPEGMWEQTLTALKEVEKQTGKGFGNVDNPLLVSIRSGAKVSMPGMMDTICNIGLNRETFKGLVSLTTDECFAYDTYHRLLQTFGRTVSEYGEVLRQQSHGVFPDDPYEQLRLAIHAVFASWFSERAASYRRAKHIPDDLGTACNIQAMVFGNMDLNSGTGVVFTRDTNTGAKVLSGNYLTKAQGEDVVGGAQNPKKIQQMQEEFPKIYTQLLEVASKLEGHYRDVQDIEFTFESGKLWILQTRSTELGVITGKFASDMWEEGLISEEEVLHRVSVSIAVHSRVPRFEAKARQVAIEEGRLLAHGLGAVPGAATGIAMIDTERAKEASQTGQSVILVRPETNPKDAEAMVTARGILTARGGDTSHAALIAKALSKPCVVGCEALKVNTETGSFIIGNRAMQEIEIISIDGSTGEVFCGSVTIELSKEPKWLPRYHSLAHDVWERTAKLYGKGQQDFDTKARQIWTNSKCETEKARVVELLTLIPPQYRIVEIPIKAHDDKALKTQMLDIVHEGKWVGLRTCYIREQPLGLSPWHMAIRSEEDVARFLNDEEFRTYTYRGRKLGGGYSTWIRNPDLREIIVLYNPPELGLSAPEYPAYDSTCEHKHFVLTVSAETNCDLVDRIVVNVKLGTDQLRSFETIDRKELIRIEMPLHPDIPFALESCEYSFFGKDAMHHNELVHQGDIDPRTVWIAQQVVRTVFEEWWNPPFDLPRVMCALQKGFNLNTLEVQGRAEEDGRLEYILVYEMRGREEREKALGARNSLSDMAK